MNLIEFNMCDCRVFYNLDNVKRFAIKKVTKNHYLFINGDQILIDEKIKESLKKMGVEL